MSGHSDSGICPSCGGDMNTYTDWKPHDQVSGECLDCGFSYYTKTYRMTLEEVNEYRENMELEPLSELVKGERVWTETEEVQNAS